jgi:hypothetical protein
MFFNSLVIYIPDPFIELNQLNKELDDTMFSKFFDESFIRLDFNIRDEIEK